MMRVRARLESFCVSGVLALVAVLAAAVPSAYAQADRGTIQGSVTDQIRRRWFPGAKVEITHLATSTVTDLATNRRGCSPRPNLPLGEYLVLVTKDGFAPATADNINIRSGVQIRVDLVLNPSGVTETVSVGASPTRLLDHHQHDRHVRGNWSRKCPSSSAATSATSRGSS